MGIRTAYKRRRSIAYSKPTTKRRKVTPARKRRNTKRAQIYRSKKITLPKYGFLPDKLCCRLKATSEPFTLDPGVGGIAVVKNLTFNTPVTGFNGENPREWNEMIALYGKCYVIGAKITVQCIPAASNVDAKCIWGIYTVKLDDPASTYPVGLTYRVISEDHRLMKGTRQVGYVAGRGMKPTVMTKKWSAKKWSGVDDYLSENTTQDKYSTVAQDADISAGCNVWLVNRTNTDSAAVTFNASVEYICVFTDRNQVNPSS